jgi:exonuclease SbcC
LIPRRVALKGFLCYRDEQVIELDGSDLWVFAGRNGSGKSAVFDGMTYALFGCHRAGQQNATALIHKGRDAFRVEFDFDLGGRTFRIRRTLRRSGRSERQIFAHEPESGRWPAVPETQTEGGLRAWVVRHLGLTFDTFTASVLLMQNQADKLLAAQPKQRFEVLAGIVDLDRYRRLHQAADLHRQALKVQAETLRGQLRGADIVEPADIEQAVKQTAEAAAARDAASAEVERLRALQGQARAWTELRRRREEAETAWRAAQALVNDSEAIGRDFRRLRELDGVLPALEHAARRLGTLADLEQKARTHAAEGRHTRRRRALAALLLADLDERLGALAAEIRRDESRRAAISERLAALAVPIERARATKRRQQTIRTLEAELAALPAAPLDALRQAEADLTACLDAQAALPALTRFAHARTRLAEAHADVESGQLACANAEAELRQRIVEHTARTVEADAAENAARVARDEATAAVTLAEHAAARLARFEHLEGATTCDQCGQPLTAEHIASERARLAAEVEASRRRAQSGQQDAAHAEAALRAARAASNQALARLDEARRTSRDAEARRDRATREIEQHAGLCAQAYDELAKTYRQSIAPSAPDDWRATRYPTNADFLVLRGRVDQVEALTKRRDAARRVLDTWTTLSAKLEQARGELAEPGAVAEGDLESLEAEQRDLRAESEALARCLERHRVEQRLADETRALLDDQCEALDQRTAHAHAAERAETARASALRDEHARARIDLPESWRPAFDAVSVEHITMWRDEHRRLRDSGVESRAEALPQAQARLEESRCAVQRLDAELAATPEAARCDPASLDRPLADARRQFDAAERTLREQTLREARLRDARARHASLQVQVLDAEREHRVADALAKLLGRDGLQRHLLREAERGIVACANPILASVSGGELSLRLRAPEPEAGDDLDHVLRLEAVERLGEQSVAHEVAFLSGSQRFRVAVSLALGIGQFARGRDRRVESVIIDEGFGGLDRVGRAEMIEHLGALRGRLARIILVSHQEEFVDAFPDGYLFERQGGATVVAPFHR